MKKTILLLALVTLVTYSGLSTVRTVSNHPAGGSQYANLQDAYNNSLSGDTLLLEGTDDPYFLLSCAWGKQITVIGIGFNPNKQIPKRAKIRNSNCYGYFPLPETGSGSKFYGIEFTHMVLGTTVSNVVFEDCKFIVNVYLGDVTTNFVFRNCIFDRNNLVNLEFGAGGVFASGTINNCVFDGFINGANSTLANVTIDHCVFLGTSGHFNALYYALISNNIFMNSFPGGTFNSTYSNNISYTAGTFPPSPANGNTASGNIENTNPLFVNVPVSTFYATSHDYHLLAGSPAIGTANDGTDIGIHGGFTGFSESGEVLINPIIRAMSIINTSVASNGTLNVQIHATKPDND